MFEDAKVGDRVWSYTDDDYGVITKIIEGDYPIAVDFNNGRRNFFTVDGKRFVSDLNPTLFWDKIEFEIPKKPKENTEVNNEKHKRMRENNA